MKNLRLNHGLKIRAMFLNDFKTGDTLVGSLTESSARQMRRTFRDGFSQVRTSTAPARWALLREKESGWK